MKKFLLLLLLISLTVCYNRLAAQTPTGTMIISGNYDMNVCAEVEDLSIEMNFNSSTDTILELRLPKGIVYDDFKIDSVFPPALAVKYVAGSDESRPRFIVSHAGTLNRVLHFTVGRTSKCAEIYSDLIDSLAIFSEGQSISWICSDPYTLMFPNISLGTGTGITNAIIGASYTRTRMLKNGSVAPVKALYIAYTKPEGVMLNSLSWKLNAGSEQNIAPYYIDGDSVYYFMLKNFPSASTLFSDADSIFINENITITGCTETLGSYKIGWMCEEDHNARVDDWCQMIEGIPSPVSLRISNPHLNYKFQYDDFQNLCEPWTYTLSFWNSSTDATGASAYYNLTMNTAFAYGLTGAAFDTTATKFNKIEILMPDGSYSDIDYSLNSVAASYKTIHIDFSQYDGTEDIPKGLSSLSFDDIYNDLKPGDTITIRITQEWICSKTCGVNKSTNQPIYIINAETMCGYERIERVRPGNGRLIRENPSGAQYFRHELNIRPGIEHNFTMNLEGSAAIVENVLNSTDKSRWAWNFNFPKGIVIRSLYYFDDTDVEHENPIYINLLGDANFSVTQDGDNQVSVTTKENKVYLLFVDFYYDPVPEECADETLFTYKMKRIDDSLSTPPCLCSEEVMCEQFDLNIICSGDCELGTINYLPMIRRVDNCLGFTNTSFTTRWPADSLTTIQKQLAIPTDTIQMSSYMRQKGVPDSLFLKFITRMVEGKEVRLEPLEAKVNCYYSGIEVGSATLPATACRVVESGDSAIFIWDLTSAISTITYDSVAVVSYYYLKNLTAAASGLTTSDFEQQGIFHYFYNKLAGDDKEYICYQGIYIPEFYMTTPTSTTALQPNYHNGCQEDTLKINFSDGISWHGRNPFPKEIRPARYWDSLYVKIENGLLLNSARLYGRYGDHRATDFVLPTPRVNNDTLIYVFHNDGNWRTGTFGAAHSTLQLCIQFSCNEKDSLMYGVDAFYKSIYANVATATPNPSELPDEGFVKRLTQSHDYVIKLDNVHPKISLPLQVTSTPKSAEGEWKLEVQNLTTVDAPYVWIAIDTSTQTNINSITVDGTELEPLGMYEKGRWLKLDTIRGETKKDVIIKYSYQICEADTLAVKIGWNCNEYPSSVADAQCAATQSRLIHPKISYRIELAQDPITLKYNVCDTIHYQCFFNNVGTGRSINNNFILTLPAGLMLNQDAVKMSFPANGELEQATLVSTSYSAGYNKYTYSIDSLSTYDPAEGLPGVLDVANPLDKQVRINFSVIPSCEFADKSVFQMQIEGKQQCNSNIPCENSLTPHYSPAIMLRNASDSVYRSETTIDLELVESKLEIYVTSVVYDIVEDVQQPRRALYKLKLPPEVSIDKEKVENLSLGTLLSITQDGHSNWDIRITFKQDLKHGDVIKFKVPLQITQQLKQCEYPVSATSYIEYASVLCGGYYCPTKQFITDAITDILRFDMGEPTIFCQDTVIRISLNQYCEADPITFPKASLPTPILGNIYTMRAIWNDADEMLTFPIEDAVHTVNWYVEDNCGNESSCQQKIIISICPCAIDYDGNIYLSAWIGGYCWTLSNMQTTHYDSGEPVEFANGYYADPYPDVDHNIRRFGRLYTWYSTVGVTENDDNAQPATTDKGNIQGVCPTGWYLPSTVEFDDLMQFDMYDLKADSLWLAGFEGSNLSGFNALPAGIYNGALDRYERLLGETYFWIMNERFEENGTAHANQMFYVCNHFMENEIAKKSAISVRCVKEF